MIGPYFQLRLEETWPICWLAVSLNQSGFVRALLADDYDVLTKFGSLLY